MAEFKHGQELKRGDVVVCIDGLIRTALDNDGEYVKLALGSHSASDIAAGTLSFQNVHYDAMNGNMLVLASIN